MGTSAVKFLKKRPLLLIGVALLVVGVGPRILSVVSAPEIYHFSPDGTLTNPTTLTVGQPITLTCYVRIVDVDDRASASCVITGTGSVSYSETVTTFNKMPNWWYAWAPPYNDERYEFVFTATSESGSVSTVTGYGVAGTPPMAEDGDQQDDGGAAGLTNYDYMAIVGGMMVVGGIVFKK